MKLTNEQKVLFARVHDATGILYNCSDKECLALYPRILHNYRLNNKRYQDTILQGLDVCAFRLHHRFLARYKNRTKALAHFAKCTQYLRTKRNLLQINF